MYTFQELLIPAEFQEAQNLLEQSELDLPDGLTYSLGAYEGAVLAATGFLAGNVLCGICVAPQSRGTGLAAAIVSRLVTHALETGYSHLMLFTKPSESDKFIETGFNELAATESATLLEWGKPDFAEWLAAAKAALAASAPTAMPTSQPTYPFPIGAIVINANPFTLGHRHLALQALEECSHLIVFVVEEEASAFPFAVRHRLVREGLADQERLTVLPGGPYMVSRASFPAYFTGKEAHSRVHAELDCTIFATRIAPELDIAVRFVGEEPYCEVTAAYNDIMHFILPNNGIKCLEIARLEQNDTPVSASSVRDLLRAGQVDQKTLAGLVPPSTAAFVTSPEAEQILKKIQQENTRH